MDPSLKLDGQNQKSTVDALPTGSSEYGVYDALREGPNSRLDQQLTNAHPLEKRLSSWENSQLGMMLHMQRRVYGLHAPLRTMMELHAIKKTPFAMQSPASRLQLDILMGKDETIDIEDIYSDNSEQDIPDVHQMLSQRLGI